MRNSGPAINAEELPALFSPFKRLVRGAYAQDTHHLGLGLYIVDRLVAAHGGRMQVTSNETGTMASLRICRARLRRPTGSNDARPIWASRARLLITEAPLTR